MFYATVYGPYKTDIVHRAIFLWVALTAFFLPGQKAGRARRFFDLVLVAVATLSLGYVVVFYDRILQAIGGTYLQWWEVAVGIAITAVAVEAIRRTSPTFFVLCLLAIAYMLFGNRLPGLLAHAGLDVRRFVFLTAFSDEGIFGLGLSVASTYLYMFLLFAAVLRGVAATEYLAQLGTGLVGRFTGGPAKATVVTDTLVGMVTGSSIGSVVATGSVTIPLMKRFGFPPHVAAAVEVITSEGSQLLPPVLGAAAFIMAELTGIAYRDIVVASLIPGLLYYLNAYAVIHFEAAKQGLRGLPPEEVPSWKQALHQGWHVLIGIPVLFYLLIRQNYTVMFSGMLAALATLVAAELRGHTRLRVREIVNVFRVAAEDAARLVGLLAGIGFVKEAVVTTGLGAQLTELLLRVAGGSPTGLVIISVVVTLLLGMGTTTPVAYTIVALFIAPALVRQGFSVMATHLFLFFFAIKSGSTPPVGVAAAVAAGIANASYWKTALTATYFCLSSFLIAFAFLFNPVLLLQSGTAFSIVTVATTAIGCVTMAAAVQRWMFTRVTPLELVLLFAGSVLLIVPELYTDIAGLMLAGFASAMNWRRSRLAGDMASAPQARFSPLGTGERPAGIKE